MGAFFLRGRTESPTRVGHAASQLAFDARRPPDAQGNGADLEGDGATVAVGSQTAQEISQGQLAVAGYLVVLEVGVKIVDAQRPGRRTHIAEMDVHQPVSEDVICLGQTVARSGRMRGVQDEGQVKLVGKGAQLPQVAQSVAPIPGAEEGPVLYGDAYIGARRALHTLRQGVHVAPTSIIGQAASIGRMQDDVPGANLQGQINQPGDGSSAVGPAGEGQDGRVKAKDGQPIALGQAADVSAASQLNLRTDHQLHPREARFLCYVKDGAQRVDVNTACGKTY